ncbi:MAG: carboxypeptidase regulatory-like domain-containing protein, partial [Planctomycetes bacterium]|nr:carboxypeptidase regulatory-like domain-containing protein [Planctomycetota bacterium]
MRALIALILLFAVAAGAYLFLSTDGTDNGGPSGLGPQVNQESNTANTESPSETNLADIDQPKERQASKPVEVGDGAISITTKGEGHPSEILGRVITSEGRPVEGATVTLTRFGGAAMFFTGPGEVDRSSDRSTETNNEGEFAFKDVEAFDRYSLIATHPDFAHVERGPLDATGGAVIEQELVLAGGTRVFGVISDTQGNMVPGATVTLTPNALGAGLMENPPTQHTTTSGADGSYEFPHCAKDTHVLTVSADGYGQVTIANLNITGEVDVERNVEMAAALLMGGSVIDSDGQPIANATVEAFSMTSRATRTQTRVQADKGGQFLFEDVPAGNYTLRVTATGFKAVTKPRIAAGEMDVLIQMMPLPTVSGT